LSCPRFESLLWEQLSILSLPVTDRNPERAASVQQDIMQQVFSGHFILKKNAFFPVCAVQVLLLTNAPHTPNQELHMRPHLPRLYHKDTLVYCILLLY